MRPYARALCSNMLAIGMVCLATPVFASGTAVSWTTSETALRAPGAGISLPFTVAGLSLSKSGEASQGGRAVDNYAQYLSEDSAIQATLYVYMPTYADASLAAYMTDKAIMERFGTKTRRTAYASAAAAGQDGRAIRAVYDDAADGALTTAAGFVHAGRWIVKMRVTGPSARRDEVLAGLDAMLAALKVDQGTTLYAATPARILSCPATDDADARLLPGSGPDGIGAQSPIPQDGQGKICVRGRLATGDGSYDMLQLADRPGGPVIVPIDDSGTVLTLDPGRDGKGYTLSIHMVGQTDFYGVYDRLPSKRQLSAILTAKDSGETRARTVVAYAPGGQAAVRDGADQIR